jgi:hypothetical protein
MRLAVICSHFNSGEFHVPRRNLLRFLRQMESLGIPVFVAELAYEGREFFLPHGPQVFHFRTDRSNVLWHKENLLNIAAALVPSEYESLAWIDPDILFMSQDWIEQAELRLQSFAVVQLFSEVWLTDEDGRCHKRVRSAMADGVLDMGLNHPGFAWAARRDLWRSAGGLCELAILGGGDAVFAAACLRNEAPAWLNYPEWKAWTDRSSTWIHENGGAGVVSGTIVHEWHGDAKDRSYVMRHLLLEGVDISRSVVRRKDGILQFSDSVSDRLRQAIQSYFGYRHEDGRS